VFPFEVHRQVVNQDEPAADGEAFACLIPPKHDWSFECFPHSHPASPSRLIRGGQIVSHISESRIEETL